MDKLGVINLALMKVGLPLAAAIEDCDWNADYVFTQMAEDALRGFPWGFAQKFAAFSRSAAIPAHGFLHAFDLPEDCLRVIDIHLHHTLRAPKARYVVSGRQLFANIPLCNARYVWRDLDTTHWSPEFTDAVACRIAAEIAALSAQDMQRAQILMQTYYVSLNNAQAVDAREMTERVPLDESILMARAGYGPRRN